MIGYFLGLSLPKPTDWNLIQLVGIMGSKMGGLEKLRWVGKTAALQKWFLKMVVLIIIRELRPTIVTSIGFERGAMV